MSSRQKLTQLSFNAIAFGRDALLVSSSTVKIPSFQTLALDLLVIRQRDTPQLLLHVWEKVKRIPDRGNTGGGATIQSVLQNPYGRHLGKVEVVEQDSNSRSMSDPQLRKNVSRGDSAFIHNCALNHGHSFLQFRVSTLLAESSPAFDSGIGLGTVP